MSTRGHVTLLCSRVWPIFLIELGQCEAVSRRHVSNGMLGFRISRGGTQGLYLTDWSATGYSKTVKGLIDFLPLLPRSVCWCVVPPSPLPPFYWLFLGLHLCTGQFCSVSFKNRCVWDILLVLLCVCNKLVVLYRSFCFCLCCVVCAQLLFGWNIARRLRLWLWLRLRVCVFVPNVGEVASIHPVTVWRLRGSTMCRCFPFSYNTTYMRNKRLKFR